MIHLFLDPEHFLQLGFQNLGQQCVEMGLDNFEFSTADRNVHR